MTTFDRNPEQEEWKDHIDPPLQENRLNMDDFNNVFRSKQDEDA